MARLHGRNNAIALGGLALSVSALVTIPLMASVLMGGGKSPMKPLWLAWTIGVGWHLTHVVACVFWLWGTQRRRWAWLVAFVFSVPAGIVPGMFLLIAAAPLVAWVGETLSALGMSVTLWRGLFGAGVIGSAVILGLARALLSLDPDAQRTRRLEA